MMRQGVVMSLAVVLACSAEKPEAYGFYVYSGRSLTQVERCSYVSTEAMYCPSLAFSPLEVATFVEVPASPEIVVYLKDVSPGNVRLVSASVDLYLEQVIHSDSRQAIGPLLDHPLAYSPLFARFRNVYDRVVPSTISRATIERMVPRAALPVENIDLVAKPIQGLSDAYVLAPSAPLPAGLYILAVVGDGAATVTAGKGAAVLRVGSHEAVASGAQKAWRDLRQVAVDKGVGQFMKATRLDWGIALPTSSLVPCTPETIRFDTGRVGDVEVHTCEDQVWATHRDDKPVFVETMCHGDVAGSWKRMDLDGDAIDDLVWLCACAVDAPGCGHLSSLLMGSGTWATYSDRGLSSRTLGEDVTKRVADRLKQIYEE
jgi:hypothetical protein